MRDALRSAIVGVLLAIIVAALVMGGFVLYRYRAASTSPVTRYLVMGTVTGPEGGEVVAFALDVDAARGEVTPLDVLADATIPGTSARTAHSAFPYGGGALVARALATQTGGQTREWVVLPAESWDDVFDEGVKITVPSGISVYTDGVLTVLPAGANTLDGGQMAALASAVDYLSESDRGRTSVALAEAAARIVRIGDLDLAGLVNRELATSSLAGSRISPVE